MLLQQQRPTMQVHARRSGLSDRQHAINPKAFDRTGTFVPVFFLTRSGSRTDRGDGRHPSPEGSRSLDVEHDLHTAVGRQATDRLSTEHAFATDQRL